ncbi:MAG TPA: hypothetical protein D7H93_01145 [Candidatus Poseidoniales archaeon]|nr:MAG TPA: hypothetical protein D7H93_01145 [Candidatus Poseidoniales archaeon]
MPGMLRLGERLFRGEAPKQSQLVMEIDGGAKVNWWNEKIQPSHPLDAMIGDRDSDMGAGWAQGVRCFKVNWTLGLASVTERILDQKDRGDPFNPLR